MDIIEHNSVTPLMELVDRVIRDDDMPWGVARVKRVYLKPMTNEAFGLALKSAVDVASAVHVFFIENKKIYIVWRGEQKNIYKHIRGLVAATMVQAGIVVDPLSIISYIDPRANADSFRESLKVWTPPPVPSPPSKSKTNSAWDTNPFDLNDDENEETVVGAAPVLAVTQEQIEYFHKVKSQRPLRKQLQILVAEDQVFSQKLLCDILRGARADSRETPTVDAVQGIQDAWKIYLKKAHDLIYVDLGLVDGSGHSLARAIKELDPMTQVIIVTANNYEEELGVAQQNNVDGFIAKPYNKKQILDCIDKYISNNRPPPKGGMRGSTGQFR